MSRSRVTPVDLSGGASTVETDELTTGATSKARAIKGGFTPDHRFPAGRAYAPTLLDAYRRFLERNAAAEQAAKGDPDDVEAQALKKSRKRLGRHLREGVSAPGATARAFQHYRKKGGRSGFDVWSSKVAG